MAPPVARKVPGKRWVTFRFEDGAAADVDYVDYHRGEAKIMAMHDPPHAGGIVRRQCLEPLGLTVTRAAEGPGVSLQTLSELLNGHTGVSVEMAIRLSKAFGSTSEVWLGIQVAYDLWQAGGCAGEIAIERFAVA